MTITKIENRDDLVKSTESAAVLAADFSAYQNHLNKRKHSKDQAARISDLEKRVLHLENMIKMLVNTNGDGNG